MLDDRTKARINSARDILVGKVPDPKSQVEQITIALIYKFMDDMDRQSEELGGKASFFSDGFKKYAWHKLIDPRLSGHERLMIYAEGLEKMNENKHIPQLFRDIFKGVFLPYRDPETLNLFLKQINEFSYDHSEQLGDAFEYLLSVLGSQGDAGQFRTPRHIIDFIVSIVGPKKNETVLDPACGTAGFLISAYKHILAANSKEGKGDLLTGDERSRLMDNFCGYDISPDMVRLSRANMYLHGFPQPRIHEYDTLTSEERWDERYDVIMANPPFMTPKGGIRPHNRFSIRATRSEVLFVDYIAEHLNVNGRAGVIVPEGIIFQSQTAYRNLRRMLLENYLWCVVSLPAGVFNPYSGVKTSIVLMDKALAKKADEILFVRIQSDGFDLGAQRRPLGKNDMPDALGMIVDWKNGRGIVVAEMAHAVSRKRLLESPDCNLSGERYRPNAVRGTEKWPLVKLEDVCKFMTGGTPTSSNKAYYESGDVPWLVSGDIHKGEIFDCAGRITVKGMENSNAKFLPKDSVLIALNGQGKTRGTVALLRMRQSTCNQSIVSIDPKDREQLVPEFLFNQLSGMYSQIRGLTGDNERSGLSISIIKTIQIPLPPLAEQKRVVAELDGYRKIIEGAKQIIANYKPVLRADPTWQKVPLEQVCSIKRGRFSHRPRNAPQFYGGSYPFMQTGDVVKSQGGPVSHTQTLNELGLSVSKVFDPPAVLITIAANIGDTGLLTYPACFPDSVVALTPNEQVKVEFLELAMRGQKEELSRLAPQAAQKNINVEILRRVEIPLPPIGTQIEIVNELEVEGKLVEASRELIARMEKKIHAKLARIWADEDK